jgi:hypothetical protein
VTGDKTFFCAFRVMVMGTEELSHFKKTSGFCNRKKLAPNADVNPDF